MMQRQRKGVHFAASSCANTVAMNLMRASGSVPGRTTRAEAQPPISTLARALVGVCDAFPSERRKVEARVSATGRAESASRYRAIGAGRNAHDLPLSYVQVTDLLERSKPGGAREPAEQLRIGARTRCSNLGHAAFQALPGRPSRRLPLRSTGEAAAWLACTGIRLGPSGPEPTTPAHRANRIRDTRPATACGPRPLPLFAPPPHAIWRRILSANNGANPISEVLAGVQENIFATYTKHAVTANTIVRAIRQMHRHLAAAEATGAAADCSAWQSQSEMSAGAAEQL